MFSGRMHSGESRNEELQLLIRYYCFDVPCTMI